MKLQLHWKCPSNRGKKDIRLDLKKKKKRIEILWTTLYQLFLWVCWSAYCIQHRLFSFRNTATEINHFHRLNKTYDQLLRCKLPLSLPLPVLSLYQNEHTGSSVLGIVIKVILPLFCWNSSFRQMNRWSREYSPSIAEQLNTVLLLPETQTHKTILVGRDTW